MRRGYYQRNKRKLSTTNKITRSSYNGYKTQVKKRKRRLNYRGKF